MLEEEKLHESLLKNSNHDNNPLSYTLGSDKEKNYISTHRKQEM